MQDFTTQAAVRMTELTNTIVDALEEMAKLTIDAANNADTRFTDLFNRQGPRPDMMRVPYNVGSVGRHLRIRAHSVGSMMEVLANVQYIRDRESIDGVVYPWRDLIREGKIKEAAAALEVYKELTVLEVMELIGFFNSVAK